MPKVNAMQSYSPNLGGSVHSIHYLNLELFIGALNFRCWQEEITFPCLYLLYE